MSETPMPANEKCPKCGIEGRTERDRMELRRDVYIEATRYVCGTLVSPGGFVDRSMRCHENERAALRATVARLEGELARERQPWKVTLSHSDSRGIPEYDECEVVDIGHSNRILLVRCPDLESALSQSVPKAAALRACRVSAMGGSCAPLDGEDAAAMIERVCAHESELEEWDVSWWGEVVEAALARALAEAAPPPSTAEGSAP